MKKLKRILSIVMLISGFAIVFGAILLLVSSCSTETDKYADYEIIDYNLTWTDTSWNLGSFVEENDDMQIKYKYKKIAGEDTDEFIGAWRRPDELFSEGSNVVLVSPDSELDIWEDWTVSKIELFFEDSHQSAGWALEEYKPEDVKRVTVADTREDEILNEFVEIVGNVLEQPKIEEGYLEQIPPPKGSIKKTRNCGIRVHFEESDHIVWDAIIRVYASDDDTIMYIERIFLDSEGIFVTEIPQNSRLYDFLMQGMFD